MHGFFESAQFLFGDYATAVAAGVVALSLASTIFRIMWEVR